MDSSQRRLALGAGAIVAVLVLVGGAVALGVGPFGGGGTGGSGNGDDGATATPPPTGTVYTDMSGGGGTADADSTQPPFSFEIVEIEECGTTCRDVTATLYNNQNETATNVSTFTRIYAGNSTAEEDRVWTGTEDVGAMDPESSVTRTQRVDLTTSEGFAIQQADGWITLLVTVTSEETTITFKERRNVA